MQPRMAMDAAHHKIVNLLKTRDFFVITCCDVFNEWTKTMLLLPVWSRDAKRLDTPGHRTMKVYPISSHLDAFKIYTQINKAPKLV